MSDAGEGRRAIHIGPVGDQVRKNLVGLRTARRLSTRALSEICAAQGRPIPATGITRIEKGERRVDVDDLLTLASALQVSYQKLIEQPAACSTCAGSPPLGFTCKECGTDA